MNSFYLLTLSLVLTTVCSANSLSQEPELRDELENFLKLYRSKLAQEKQDSTGSISAVMQKTSSDDSYRDADMSRGDEEELPSIGDYLEAVTMCTKLVDRLGFVVEESVALNSNELKVEVCRVAIFLYQLFGQDGESQTVDKPQPTVALPQRSIDFRSLLLGQRSKARYDYRSIEPQNIGLRSFDRIGHGPLQLGKRSIDK